MEQQLQEQTDLFIRDGFRVGKVAFQHGGSGTKPVRCVLPEAPCRERMIARSTMTVKRSLKELEDAGLILRVRQGFGEPNKIYVLIPKKEDSRL